MSHRLISAKFEGETFQGISENALKLFTENINFQYLVGQSPLVLQGAPDVATPARLSERIPGKVK